MDIKQIDALIKKFDASRLTELKIEVNGLKMTMKAHEASVADRTGLAGGKYPVPSQPAIEPIAQTPADATHKSSDTETITSPIVGTFYRSPAPDAPPFVDTGSKVESGGSLCIIEAMKVMNKLEAEFPCEIVNILAESGELVEYGAPLFEVKRL